MSAVVNQTRRVLRQESVKTLMQSEIVFELIPINRSRIVKNTKASIILIFPTVFFLILDFDVLLPYQSDELIWQVLGFSFFLIINIFSLHIIFHLSLRVVSHISYFLNFQQFLSNIRRAIIMNIFFIKRQEIWPSYTTKIEIIKNR